jgi:hypothetical protein
MIAFASTLACSQTAAVKANDFLNTIGVNTGICYGSDNPTTVVTLIKQFGIRQIRDDDNDNPSCDSTFISVYQQTGAKFELVPVGTTGQSDITTYISDTTTLANAGALLALEGPNEPYYQPVGWNGETSSNTASPYWTPVADYQQALYSQIKSNSVLKNYPVWDLSLGGWESNDVGLQWLTIPSNPPDASTLQMPVGTQYADYANVHNYTSEACWIVYPTFPVANMMWDQESTSETLEADACVLGLFLDYGQTLTANYTLNYLGYTATQLATLPKVSTETGFQESNSNPPFALTDDQIGRLYLDLFLDAVKNGWAYTFLYELHDSGDGYGLVSSSYAVRTQGTYLQNFTTILADTSSNFTAGSLNYSVPSEPATVHDLLLQKSNGTFYIAVWDEEQPGSSTKDTVTVDLGGTYNVAEYDPTKGTSATTTLTGVSTVSLTLSLSPILLQLSSTSVPPAPVADAATSISSTGFTANWTASSGATDYYLDVSTSSSFSSFVSGYNNLSVGNVTSYAVSGLTASTTYYYRVRASNSAGTSGNSNTISVTTSASVTIPAAPVAAAATSISSTGFTANWAASSGATDYYLDVSTSSSFSSFVSGYNNLSVGNVTSYAVSGLTASTTYYYRVRASNSAGTSGNSNTISVTTSAVGALPSPWVTEDIGATGTSDSASYSNGVFTVSGGNGDIQGTSDNFRYVDESTSGNWTVVAQVTSITDVDSWGKAGVMIRASTAANAVYAGIFVTVGDGIAWQYRTKAGGNTTAVAADDYGLYWVKIVQSGSSFSGYYSTNGTSWTKVGSSVTISAMPSSATAGLAVSSDTAGDLCTATFANVTSN